MTRMSRFWHSPHAIRYSFDEHGNGLDKIHAHRVWRPPGPGTKAERDRHKILTIGDDSAAVNLEFKMRGQDRIGRQSQTWVRFPDLGWTVVAAHVSTMDYTYEPRDIFIERPEQRAVRYNPADTAGPIPSAKTTVPIPTFPPRNQPASTTVSSMTARRGATGAPVTLCRPVINPSRGPGPKLATR